MKCSLLCFAVLLSMALTFIGCGGGSSSSNPPSNANVFVTGEDAPLPSVVSFNLTLNSMVLNGQSGTAQVLASPITVDFARLVGLRSPLAFNSVAADTYSSATITLANPVISYLNLSTNPPTVSTMNGTLTEATITVNFPKPLVVGANGLAGVHMEFDVRQSLAVDGTGQITGSVDPHIYIEAVKASDAEGEITELMGGLSSVNASANSFVIQGPYGHQFTIDVNGQTAFNSGWSINNLAMPAFISVVGDFQADGSILASDVQVVATTQAFVSGRILAVNPATGPVQTVTMWVGEELPALSTIPVDSVATIDVSLVSTYGICFFDNWMTNAVFNSSSLIAGQRIFLGGSYVSNTFTPQVISLRRQGVAGDLVANSVTVVGGNRGSFQLQNNGMLGYVLGAPMTVETGDTTVFINVAGLSGLQSSGAVSLVTRGLVLKDATTGAPVMWAHRVREVQ
jgi:hypothetical protein